MKFMPHENKVLRNMVSAPWYIRNNGLHKGLQVDVVSSETQSFAQKHEGRLYHHENVEAIQLLDNMGIVRRLQRKKNLSLSVSVKAESVLVQVCVKAESVLV
jgi:hypothetical protein